MLFLTTVFKGDERTSRKRKRPSTDHPRARPVQRFFGKEAVKEVNIPTVAAFYNDEMNHVDRGDQLRAYLGYDHPLRRGAWQALTWTFLFEVILVNTYLLQLHGQPDWAKYIDQQEWRECIFNALFNFYSEESDSRKHYRTGVELDTQDRQKCSEHSDRGINHVNRGVKSDCLACQGFQQGQPRSRGQKRSPLVEVTGNTRKKRGGQTWYGCKLCNVAICNNQNCWDFYHRPIY